ncbi:hypothetical protein B0H10DRAFT_2203300 [Mycena sp. CBHHK59/15]|nr:hypothetical protein B0H10DRAFT_2203300 [Mycena sp. CBHHK59/15]
MAPSAIISALKTLHSAPIGTKIRLFYESKISHFQQKRRLHPFANKGGGSVYFVACFNNDIPAFRGGAIDGSQLLTRAVLKGSHSCQMEQHQAEYRKCDVGDTHTHVWICEYLVERCYYCEHFLHLTTFRDGGVRAVRVCPCGVSHREFFTFASVGGLANFEAKMLRVLKSMGERVIRIPFPSSPVTEDLYDLVCAS